MDAHDFRPTIKPDVTSKERLEKSFLIYEAKPKRNLRNMKTSHIQFRGLPQQPLMSQPDLAQRQLNEFGNTSTNFFSSRQNRVASNFSIDRVIHGDFVSSLS